MSARGERGFDGGAIGEGGVSEGERGLSEEFVPLPALAPDLARGDDGFVDAFVTVAPPLAPS